MSESPKKQELIDMLLSECNTLAQKERRCHMLGIEFEWPTIAEQINGNGSVKKVKRGRAKYERDMFVIPGFEIRGHAPFPGFVCHPSAALSSAAELIRLFKESKK